MKFKLAILATALALATGAAQSAVITYAFTTTLGDGFFSYDDGNLNQLPRPTLGSSLASWYAAERFRFAGVDYNNPAIGIIHLTGSDSLSVYSDAQTAGSNSGISLSFIKSNGNVFGSEALSELNDLQLSDFNSLRVVFVDLTSGNVTSLTQVPEPGSLALAALAIGALGLARRRPLTAS